MDFKLWILVLISCYLGESKRLEDTVVDPGDWKFITRFCFLAAKGTLRYTFEYPATHSTPSILLYFDEDDQWPAVYKSGKTCEQKVAALNPANNQIIYMSVLTSWSGCNLISKYGQDFVKCSGGRIFKSTRERWWFIAVSRCDQSTGGTGLNFTYDFHMTNAQDDDLLRHEFSADEFYILPIDISFLLGYVLLLVLSCICAFLLKQRQLFHTTYKMYMIALILWLVQLFFLSLSYGIYGGSGYEQPETKLAGRIFGTASELIFLLMLVLMGKGYTITRGVLSTQSTIVITVFFSAYTVCYAAVFIYEAEKFDPGEVLYTYESPPGYGLIALRLIGWVWFCYSVFFTVKNNKSKKLFYYPFFIFYTIWFLAGPIVIFVAMYRLDLWTREKTVVGVENFVAFCGHIVFLILTRPQAANKNFPYHVRTTQIASLTGTEVDGFNSYNYNSGGLGSSPSGPDLSNLFVTSHSRSTDKLVTMGGDDADYEMRSSRKSSDAFNSVPPPHYEDIKNKPVFTGAGLPSPTSPSGSEDVFNFNNCPPPTTRRNSEMTGIHPQPSSLNTRRRSEMPMSQIGQTSFPPLNTHSISEMPEFDSESDVFPPINTRRSSEKPATSSFPPLNTTRRSSEMPRPNPFESSFAPLNADLFTENTRSHPEPSALLSSASFSARRSSAMPELPPLSSKSFRNPPPMGTRRNSEMPAEKSVDSLFTVY